MNRAQTFLFCFALVGALGSKTPTAINRIVGGSDAEPGEFPSLVGLRGDPAEISSYCGGSVIADRWVLTAAHCASDDPLYVTLGNHKWSEVEANEQTIQGEWHVHPDYNDVTLVNDIALIYLAEAADEVHTRAIPIYDSVDNASLMEAGADIVVAGWGTLEQGGDSPDTLQKVTIPLVSSAYCADAYGATYNEDFMICAGTDEGGIDSCQGDSGGPMYSGEAGFEGVQVGVVSFGIGCGDPGVPGVYVRLANYEAWVKSIIDPCPEHTCDNGDVVVGDPTNDCEYVCDDTPEESDDDEGASAANTVVFGFALVLPCLAAFFH